MHSLEFHYNIFWQGKESSAYYVESLVSLRKDTGKECEYHFPSIETARRALRFGQPRYGIHPNVDQKGSTPTLPFHNMDNAIHPQ